MESKRLLSSPPSDDVDFVSSPTSSITCFIACFITSTFDGDVMFLVHAIDTKMDLGFVRGYEGDREISSFLGSQKSMISSSSSSSGFYSSSATWIYLLSHVDILSLQLHNKKVYFVKNIKNK